MKMKFTIECEMEERWKDYFLSFLKSAERCGEIGHSQLVGLYVDGDGDFRPKFNANIEFENKEPNNIGGICVYDAG